MKRRNFISTLPAFGAIPSLGLVSKKSEENTAEKPFTLNFAPYQGMFKNLAGESILDRLVY